MLGEMAVPDETSLVRTRPARPSPAHALRHRLEAARRRAFVGRATELAAFRAALADDAASAVLFVHGAGGTGKTTLLRRFATEAEDRGRPVVRPRLFDAAAPVVASGGRTLPAVVLVDDLDDRTGAEPWLRETFLPGLPLGSVVVLAGRTPPGPEWTTDPGWQEVLSVHRLGDLAPDEARLLLDRRSVPRDQHAALLAVGDGNPLALLVGADALAEGGSTDGVGLAVAHAVLDRVVGPTPTPAHRRALEICAAHQPTTEAALTAVGDATELFRWLRALPFVDQAPDGLRLRPFVREAIRTERSWRNPGPEIRRDAGEGGAAFTSADGGAPPGTPGGGAALVPDGGGAAPGSANGGAIPGTAGGHDMPAVAPADGARPLTRDAFESGIRDALRTWRRPDLLARNPLVRSRLLAARPEHDRVDALRAVLQEALDEMGRDPREAKSHRALLATYLGGAPTQEAAAERLGLPFSTYRRHLGQGLSVLVSLLWWQETRGDRTG